MFRDIIYLFRQGHNSKSKTLAKLEIDPWEYEKFMF